MKALAWLRGRPHFFHVFLPVVVLLGFVLIFGSLLFVRHRNEMRTGAIERIAAVATVQEARIEANLRENFEVDLGGLLERSGVADDIRHLGGDLHDPASVGELQQELELSLNPAFSDLLVTSRNGTVLASTDRSRVDTQYRDTDLISAAGEVATSGGLSLNSRGELIGTTAGPLVSSDGHTHILVLESDASDLVTLATDYTGLGETGETVVATRDERGAAVFIVPLRFDAEASFSRIVAPTELDVPITQALRNNETSFTDATDYRGEPVLAATRYIPLTDVGLVVKIDRAEALAAIDRLATDLLTVYFGLVLFAIALGGVLVRLLNRQDRLRQVSNVFEEAIDPMILTDPDGTILDANPRAIASYGWPRRDLIGTSIGTLSPPGDEDIAQEMRDRSWTGQDTEAVEVARLCKSGTVVPVLVTMSTLTDATGNPVALVTVEKDMSDSHRIRRELMEAKEAAEEANRAKSEFLSRMSHELRTPLNSVIGFAQILELSLAGSEDLESVAYIRSGGEHLLGLIEDLLDLSRIDAGTLGPSVASVALRSLTLDCIGLVRPQLSDKRVEVVANPGSEHFVSADQDQLRQVILNLMSNAIKFNHVDGLITIDISRDQDTTRWTITDTGIGISSRHLGDLFKPFERLGADDKGIPGTGLGLALSKRLIERMGGRIGVETVEGRGSTFWIELPADARVGSTDPDSTAGGAQEAFPNVQGSVLYIDDDPDSVGLISHVATRFPSTKLWVASNGSTGLDLARQKQPDLILLGGVLADSESLAVLARLRGDTSTMDIPVAVVSADPSDGTIRRFFAAGIVDYVKKPVDLRVLSNLVVRYVGRTPSHAGGPHD